MKAFSTVILYVSWNDAASGKDPEWTVDKYDQLVSLLRCSNNDCRIILCSLVPRGDVDVTKIRSFLNWRLTGKKQINKELSVRLSVMMYPSMVVSCLQDISVKFAYIFPGLAQNSLWVLSTENVVSWKILTNVRSVETIICYGLVSREIITGVLRHDSLEKLSHHLDRTEFVATDVV